MQAFIPLWIIGAPFIGLLVLSFSFKGSSSMGGAGVRLAPRQWGAEAGRPASILDPMHPDARRRVV